MNPIILSGVSKIYGQKAALDNITLSFKDKITTALLGPSGSGKSTLLQLINGLIVPTRGAVEVFGKPIDYGNLPFLRRQLGYAVQGTGLFPHLTVENNITLLARLSNWPEEKQQQRMTELMDLVNLTVAYTGKYPYQISGGEQQRVGLCRAMMLNPKIFLLDEAFGSLDPITRSEIHAEFACLQKLEPRTMIMVTHDLREALKLADEIVILNKGQIEQFGTRSAILEKPETEFVEKFVHMHLDDDVKV